MFNGLNMGMGNLALLSDAKTYSISPENYTGEKGKGGMCELENGFAKVAARELGKGWKVNPFIKIAPRSIVSIADIACCGCIQQIWITMHAKWRDIILRIYWDNCDMPSVECPIGDFFASGWETFAQISSAAVCVNPGKALNCYWQMPFRTHCKVTLENRGESEASVYYQINYTQTEIPVNCGYFHAQFRRVNPLTYKDVYTIVDCIKGKGHYVGTYLAWQSNNCRWWGEGEIKFFMDGDCNYPTICGTGTEDYFGGSHNFESFATHQYQTFTTPYSGLHQVIRPDGLYQSQQRFGMYRWHIMDPIRFDTDLKVTIQALGWKENGSYLPLQDDISSVAFWYQDAPSATFPPLPAKEYLDIN